MARSNDAYLTSKVKTFLVTADGVPANSIKVTTDKSVVYLMGVVTAAEGDRATDVARNASGVQKVVKAFDYVQRGRARPPGRRRQLAESGCGQPVRGHAGAGADRARHRAERAGDLRCAGWHRQHRAGHGACVLPTALPPGRNLP